ncbi:hypothetical protein [Clostridium sp.]|uniref:hypothetical protein n=1 Tax=Clostridium sp. TaxID=1506 RepID=UPI001B71BCBD|nr:hypothetical protein [Clostridium sp.]MBP3915458.1 hypothetical protein [Clostridium sp.]
MIIEKNIETVENGLNEIISRISYLKDYDENNIPLDSIGAVRGLLSTLEEIEILESVLQNFGINHNEYEGNIIKVTIKN